jgi:hypothetical protein
MYDVIFYSILFLYSYTLKYIMLYGVVWCGVQASTQCRHSSLTILLKRMTKQATAMMVRHTISYFSFLYLLFLSLPSSIFLFFLTFSSFFTSFFFFLHQSVFSSVTLLVHHTLRYKLFPFISVILTP